MSDHELPRPVYNPELNEGLDGSYELGEFLFPRKLDAEKVEKILDGQTQGGEDWQVTGSTQPYFQVINEDVGEKYDLVYAPEPPSYDWDRVRAVAVRDLESDSCLAWYDLDELTRNG